MNAECPPPIDYTAMTATDMVQALEDDAAKWAAAFKQHAEKLGHHGMSEGWLIGWFANAIEHSSDVRHWRGQRQVQPLAENFPR